uniref:Retrotransposon gag domain-containing protein n=1 Tax=Ananas comosus var. bracteatus TaxID=296719 RepID=A0A6V7QHJ5_ANACO|nr:unnamed protein product [Ananas comosus var. bracteatus]
MSSVLEGGRSPSGDALRSYASRVGVNPKDGPSGHMAGLDKRRAGFRWVPGRDRLVCEMPITRSQSAEADNAVHLEEVETSATSRSGEVQELRSQLAALTDLVTQQAEAARQQTEAARRQEARMKRLEDLLLQQAAASRETQAHTPPAPVVDRPPVGAAFPTLVEGAERDRLMERLNEFRRCSPRIFDGEKVDHWIVEKWLMHMEKLFRDTFVEERDRVWLATHHLDGEAYRWWLDLQENPNTDLAAITWKKFKELLLAHYFLTSVKRKMEQDFATCARETGQ